MKKIIIIIIALFVLFSSACAEIPDLSSLSFDELSNYKILIDAEYFSRPESSGMILHRGEYIVGQDIKQGSYYAAMTVPDESSASSFFRIYEDYDTFLKEAPNYSKLASFSSYLFLDSDPIRIIVKDGNVISVLSGSVFIKASTITDSERYKYEVPDGTIIPKGSYAIPKDIPSGTYIAYAATLKGGDFKHYYKIDGEVTDAYNSYHLYIKKTIPSEKIELSDGENIVIETPIILSKMEKLNFD